MSAGPGVLIAGAHAAAQQHPRTALLSRVPGPATSGTLLGFTHQQSLPRSNASHSRLSLPRRLPQTLYTKNGQMQEK